MSWDPTHPRKDPFPEVVTLMAQSGYGVHRARKQQARNWAELHDHERFRWQLAADAMANHHLHSPEQIRAVYFLGYTDMPWDDAKPAVRKRWDDIAQAMRAALDRWVAEQKREAERETTARRLEMEKRKAAEVTKQELQRAKRPVITPSATTFTRPDPVTTTAQVATLRDRIKQKRAQERKEASA